MSDDVTMVDDINGDEEGFQVKVGKLPGTVKEVFVNGNGTVTIGDVLSQADLSSEGFEIRLNGNPATLNDLVSNQDTVLLVRKIQGNN